MPSEFWRCTLDEVIWYIKSRVDDWRIQRSNAFLIHISLVGSKAALDMYSALPLLFDSEIEKQDAKDQYDQQQFYNQAVVNMPEINWAEKFKRNAN